MGTYTTNYQLYMPTVGETGWGTLVNTNFSTIDSTMKGLINRITAVENEVNGALNCASVTTSGKITGNGGIAGTTGTFSGAVTGASFNGVVLKSSGVITVTPTSNYRQAVYFDFSYDTMPVLVLPPYYDCTYTGSLKFKNPLSSTQTLVYCLGASDRSTVDITANSTYTLSFTNVPWVGACNYARGRTLQMSGYKLS